MAYEIEQLLRINPLKQRLFLEIDRNLEKKRDPIMSNEPHCERVYLTTTGQIY